MRNAIDRREAVIGDRRLGFTGKRAADGDTHPGATVRPTTMWGQRLPHRGGYDRSMVGPTFECRDCDRRVSALSYRAACPDCGGALDRQVRAG